MGCVTKDCLQWMAKALRGIIVTVDEIDDLIEAGILPLDKHGYVAEPGGLEALEKWDGEGRPGVSSGERAVLRSHSSASVGTSDIADRLYRLTIERMGKEKISYVEALSKIQAENPELARKIAAELDEFRNRNRPDRLRG